MTFERTDKNKCFTHLRSIKIYEAMGMKVEKKIETMNLKQKKWLKNYSGLNTQLKSKAGKKFSGFFWKSMNNKLHEKGVEDLKKKL